MGTSRIEPLIKNHHHYFHQYISPLITFEQFKRYRNYVTSEIVLSKKQYYSDLLDGVKTDMKKTWNVIYNIIYKMECYLLLLFIFLLFNNINYCYL